jgi:2-dehydro-3-deoxyphosphogluconate aldolase/(4S)-4-hydroxy-2-oxoglutarate aldolase
VNLESELAAAPVMVIIRNESPERTVELCEAAWDLGVRVVEVPVQVPDAVPSLAAAVRAGERRGIRVGAGSIHTLDQWDAAIDAGAAFTVASATVPDVLARAQERGITHVPGVATGSEVAAALAGGATWLKAFPASVLTPAWIDAIRAPFPMASFVATGGVTADNARAFLDAGCRAVAFGSSFARPDTARAIRELLGA